MFGRKKDDDGGADAAAKPDQAPAAPARQRSRPSGQPAPVRPALTRPDLLRRTPAIHAADPHGATDEPDGKRLIVGREIVLNGEIKDCDKLIVEGRVEASVNSCRELEIAECGTFKGSATIDIARISGSCEGTLDVHGLLQVRATGRLTGVVRYGEIEIERGGVIGGDIQPAASAKEAATPAQPAKPVAAAAADTPAE
jgi:cytoskeletal protein CcmA (bactofilin family)